MSSPMLFVSFFRWFDEISVVFEAEKKSQRQSVTRKRMFACSIHSHRGWLWKSNVKRRKSVLTLLIEIERVKGLGLGKSHWKECVGPVSENVKKRKSVGR